MNACAGMRRDGNPCTAPVFAGASYCFSHDPSRAADRAEARARGGRNRSTAARAQALMPPRLVPVFRQLEIALREVHRGDLDPRVASAMAAVARAMVAVLTTGEFEERLRKLEAAATDGA